MIALEVSMVLRMITVLALVLLIPFPRAAEDIQLRVLLHRAPRSGFTWGGWLVAPNVLAENRKIFAVAGPTWRSSDKKAWVELMGGASLDENGQVNALLDFRSLRNFPKAEVFFETIYDTHLKRTGVMFSGTTPLAVRRCSLKIGVEAESFTQRGTTMIAWGPRLAIPFAMAKKKCSLSGAYLLKRGTNAVRLYFLTAL